MNRLSIPILLLVATLSLPCAAQVSVSGDNPASVRWSMADAAPYMLIYPRGMDSLATVYGLELQRFAPKVSRSVGFMPNCGYKRRMPVILDALYGYANGSVTWMPRRMELYTMPDPYAPDPLPWVTSLAVHESRHAAQLQFGRSGAFRGLHYVFGELFAGAASGIYPNQHLLEGDAVVAETGLTRSGRGRSADFLEYFGMAMDSGDMRDWHQWRWGAQDRYTPNHYLIGYQTIAGVRAFYGDPLFMERYLSGAAAHPLRLGNMQRTVKEASLKRFRDTWDDMQERYAAIFRDNAARRAPFTEAEEATPTPRRWTEYDSPVATGGVVYVIKSSLTQGKTLTRIDTDGTEADLKDLAANTYHLAADPVRGRIYWSEAISSPRWSLKSTSRIRRYDITDGTVRSVTTEGRLFNPSASPDGAFLVAASYPYAGGTELLLLDAMSGATVDRMRLPDSLQVTEAVWTKGATGLGRGASGTAPENAGAEGCRIVFAGISGHGAGLYSVGVRSHASGSSAAAPAFHGGIRREIAPQPVKIKQLTAYGEATLFVSDRSGVNDIYSWSGGELRQLTSTRYGASAPAVSDGELYFCELRPEGRLLRHVPLQSLNARPASLADRYLWPVAEILSRQEEALAAEAGDLSADGNGLTMAEAGTTAGSTFRTGLQAAGASQTTAGRQTEAQATTGFRAAPSPRPYRKPPHLIHFHSWAPIYFDYDEISSLSGDFGYEAASLGATALFQNHLGDAYGSIGLSLHGDPAANEYPALQLSPMMPSGHLNFTYSGLPTVLKLSVDYGGAKAKSYGLRQYQTLAEPRKAVNVLAGTRGDEALLDAELTAYMPLSFSSGGWSRGLIPQAAFKFSNNRYSNGMDIYVIKDSLATGLTSYDPADYKAPYHISGKSGMMRQLDLSLRFYCVQPTPSARIYPKLGIGLELGLRTHPGLGWGFSKVAYGYAYGYLPGLTPTQGLRLTALAQHISERTLYASNAANCHPRGFSSSGTGSFLATFCPNQVKVTLDYAIPFAPVGWSFLSPVAYIRNFEAIPFVDYTALGFYSAAATSASAYGTTTGSGLYSAGLTLNVHLGNFFWLPYDTRIGLTVAYNGGSSFSFATSTYSTASHSFIGLNFDISL